MSNKGVGPLLAKEVDIDLNAVISGERTQLVETERQYTCKLKELADFCGVQWNPDHGLAPSELFSDDRLAKYLHALLEQFGPGQSRRKTTLAAINDCLKKHGLPRPHKPWESRC